MELLVLSADDLREALPMTDAVAAMKTAFVALSTGGASAPPRGVVESVDPAGMTLLMGAAVPEEGLGAKVVSIFHGNAARRRPVVNGLLVVMDPATGEPAALCDGTFLTAWRTGAASGAATDLLARRDARVAAVFGCGAQARTQVLGIDAVRELGEIRIFGRRSERAHELARALQSSVRAELRVVDRVEAALDGAEVVCAATNSPTPLFDGALLHDGVHLNGVGSFTPAMQELDATTVARARIFVDTIEAARAEAGELIAAEAAGITRAEDWTELGLVAAGRAAGRQAEAEITLFKSVGQAVQDVVAGARALQAARQAGLGRELVL